MAYISENVRKNAQKCMECAIRRLGEGLDKKMEFYKQAKFAADTALRASCNMCPYRADFEKVYGMTPYEYFENQLK